MDREKWQGTDARVTNLHVGMPCMAIEMDKNSSISPKWRLS